MLNAPSQLVQPKRKFVREGFAEVSSPQGMVPSMVVLFRDSLLIASVSTRRSPKAIDFCVDSHIPLREITYEEETSGVRVNHCGSSLVLRLVSEEVKRLWLRDLDASLRSAKETPRKLLPEVVVPERKVVSFADSSGLSPSKTPSISCWLQQQTISAARQNLSLARQLSGYVLRRRSVVNEWQRLWAQISGTQNLVLYLSHTGGSTILAAFTSSDLKPIAILSLIGSSVAVPSVDESFTEETGRNDYLFKLNISAQQSLIFRVESRYELTRWITEIHESSTLDRDPPPLDPLTMLAIS
uniref:PH domain-containing protein n=1 Tax=Steinernema glaseri TaxID=37863 RepID=A0A1I7ZIS4_9BILA